MATEPPLRGLPLLAALVVVLGLGLAAPLAVLAGVAPVASAHGGGDHDEDDRDRKGHDRDKDEDDEDDDRKGRDRDKDDDLERHGLLGELMGKERKPPKAEKRHAPTSSPVATPEPPPEVVTLPLLPRAPPDPEPMPPATTTRPTALPEPVPTEGTSGPDEELRTAGSVFGGAARHLMLIGGVALVVALFLLVTGRRR